MIRATIGLKAACAALMLAAASGCGQNVSGPNTASSNPADTGSTLTSTASAGTGGVGGSAAVTAALASAPVEPSASGTTINFVRAAAAKVQPAVVTVHTLAEVRRQPMTLEEMMQGGGRVGVRQGAGSGVLISPDGYLITNNHVVAGAQRVSVLVGETAYDARVVGTDALTDIAVVKVNAPPNTKMPVAQLGDSDRMQVGDWAVAVGDPLDIGSTVTLGIISAIGARGPRLEGDMARTVLQTDAAINPGNSGGALANSDGQVIGINEAIASPTGSFVGIGFAIPINSARQVAQQIIANGRVIRPYLGISYVPVREVPPAARAQAGISSSLTSGLVVAQVGGGTPAAQAGLRPGDVIVQADGQTLADQAALSKITAAHKVGDTLRLQVQRGGQSTNVNVPLRERPASFGAAPPEGGR